MAQVFSEDVLGLEALVVARRSVLHGIYVHNDDAATIWIHLWDAAALDDVDPSTDVGDIAVVSVPADTAIAIPFDVSCDSGIVVGSSTTAAAGGSAGTAVSILVGYG